MSKRQTKKQDKLNKRIMKEMRFDLRSPCDDCPFRTNAPMHEGIIAELTSKIDSLLDDGLVHSCHKTDPRADCEAHKRAPKGSPVQHCAGALIMMEKMGRRQIAAVFAEIKGIYDPKRLNMEAPVFSSPKEMLLYYVPGLIAKMPNHPEMKKLKAVVAELVTERSNHVVRTQGQQTTSP